MYKKDFLVLFSVWPKHCYSLLVKGCVFHQMVCICHVCVCVCTCLYVNDLHFSMRTSQQLSVSHKGYLTLWKLMERSSHNTRHSELKKIRGEKKIMQINGSIFRKCGSSAGWTPPMQWVIVDCVAGKSAGTLSALWRILGNFQMYSDS